MVDKWHAYLEGVGHREAVAERQDVIRQERGVVEVQPGRETGDMSLRAEDFAEPGTCGRPRNVRS